MRTKIFLLVSAGLLLSSYVSGENDYGFVPSQSENSYTLLKTIDISDVLSPDGDRVRRPDVIAIGDELYLSYGILTERNHHLVKFKADLDLTPIVNNPIELFSGYNDFSVDIRVSKANNKLWYAFEDNKFYAPVGEKHFLNAAWYSETINLIGLQTNITAGITTCIPKAFSVHPADVSPNPEAGDDPTPFWHNNSYYIFTRAWSGFIAEFTPNSKHHIRVFNQVFEKIDDFLLDFSSIMPGKTLSQNTFVNIEGQIYLIGGFYNMRNDVRGGSAVYAIPLSNDLKSTGIEKIPLLTETGKWFAKTTAARVYKGKLIINYQQYIYGNDTQNIAIFDIDNNYELIKTLQISSVALGREGIIANHTTFEILNDMLFVFYPEINSRIFVKIYSL